MVTIYSKPGCVQCAGAYRALFKDGIDFTVVVLNNAPQEVTDYVMGLGHMQAPVIVIDGDHWSGYRPDKHRQVRDLLIEQGFELNPCAEPNMLTDLVNAIKVEINQGAETIKSATILEHVSTARKQEKLAQEELATV